MCDPVVPTQRLRQSRRSLKPFVSGEAIRQDVIKKLSIQRIMDALAFIVQNVLILQQSEGIGNNSSADLFTPVP